MNGLKTEVSYPATIPEKAVHLIRNPFDNIVSRLHLLINTNHRKNYTAFKNGREGFREGSGGRSIEPGGYYYL